MSYSTLSIQSLELFLLKVGTGREFDSGAIFWNATDGSHGEV